MKNSREMKRRVINLPDDESFWAKLNYNKVPEHDTQLLVTNKNVSAKIIKQIITTSHLDYGLFIACQHELAQIEDIFDCINRLSPKYSPMSINLYEEFDNALFFLKRNQLNVYMQKTYNLDTTHMTVTQIKDMLNISY
jgi:hypothetical protein